MSDRMNTNMKAIDDDIEQMEELVTDHEMNLTHNRFIYASIAVAGIRIIAKALMVIAVEMRQHRP